MEQKGRVKTGLSAVAQQRRDDATASYGRVEVTLSPCLLNSGVTGLWIAGRLWANTLIPQKNSFKIQMWGCVTMPRATNGRLIIWGKIRMAKQGPDGSLRNCARDPNTDVTRAEWRQEESQNDLKISIFPPSLCEEQL